MFVGQRANITLDRMAIMRQYHMMSTLSLVLLVPMMLPGVLYLRMLPQLTRARLLIRFMTMFDMSNNARMLKTRLKPKKIHNNMNNSVVSVLKLLPSHHHIHLVVAIDVANAPTTPTNKKSELDQTTLCHPHHSQVVKMHWIMINSGKHYQHMQCQP